MNESTGMKKLMDEIQSVLLEIKEKFPEMYVLLDEMPITLSTDNKEMDKDELDTKDMKEYLNSLNARLKEKNDTLKEQHAVHLYPSPKNNS